MEEVIKIEPIVKQRKKLSKEALDKLQNARVQALEKRRAIKKSNEELALIKKTEPSIGSKKLTDANNEIEVYKKIKERVDNELKTNELTNIKNGMVSMMDKFNNIDTNLSSYIQERKLKSDAKQKRQVLNELPSSISKNILNEELKKMELDRFHKAMFGF